MAEASITFDVKHIHAFRRAVAYSILHLKGYNEVDDRNVTDLMKVILAKLVEIEEKAKVVPIPDQPQVAEPTPIDPTSA
jgi:hypothetical protein